MQHDGNHPGAAALPERIRTSPAVISWQRDLHDKSEVRLCRSKPSPKSRSPLISRFGRNYIEFGQYADYLFPSLCCRFIALNNGIDTMSDNGSTDVMCFLNLFNEFYSRDTSKKVKAVKRACVESGNFMGTYPAYGYKRDPEDKHHLVIDEETAPTVRRIFAMRAAGMGFRAIAATLNEEGVLPPGALYYQRKGHSDPRNVSHKWAETTVKALIRSEVYIGNMVQGKTGTLSYKSRKFVG